MKKSLKKFISILLFVCMIPTFLTLQPIAVNASDGSAPPSAIPVYAPTINLDFSHLAVGSALDGLYMGIDWNGWKAAAAPVLWGNGDYGTHKTVYIDNSGTDAVTIITIPAGGFLKGFTAYIDGTSTNATVTLTDMTNGQSKVVSLTGSAEAEVETGWDKASSDVEIKVEVTGGEVADVNFGKLSYGVADDITLNFKEITNTMLDSGYGGINWGSSGGATVANPGWSASASAGSYNWPDGGYIRFNVGSWATSAGDQNASKTITLPDGMVLKSIRWSWVDANPGANANLTLTSSGTDNEPVKTTAPRLQGSFPASSKETGWTEPSKQVTISIDNGGGCALNYCNIFEIVYGPAIPADNEITFKSIPPENIVSNGENFLVGVYEGVDWGQEADVDALNPGWAIETAVPQIGWGSGYKALVPLTGWNARIQTVTKTIKIPENTVLKSLSVCTESTRSGSITLSSPGNPDTTVAFSNCRRDLNTSPGALIETGWIVPSTDVTITIFVDNVSVAGGCEAIQLGKFIIGSPFFVKPEPPPKLPAWVDPGSGARNNVVAQTDNYMVINEGMSFPYHNGSGGGTYQTPVVTNEKDGSIYSVWIDGTGTNNQPATANLNIAIARKDGVTGEVTYAVVMPWADADSAHCSPSVAIDKDGYIHVIGSMHGSGSTYVSPNNPYNKSGVSGPWIYFVSKEPNSIAGGFEYIGASGTNNINGPNPRGLPGKGITYGRFFTAIDGTIFVTYRQEIAGVSGSSNDYIMSGLARYDTETRTWTALGGTNYPGHSNETAARNTTSIFWSQKDSGNSYDQGQMEIYFEDLGNGNERLHIAGMLQDWGTASNDGYAGSQIAYGYSDDYGDTFYRADGTQYAELPIRRKDAGDAGTVVGRPWTAAYDLATWGPSEPGGVLPNGYLMYSEGFSIGKNENGITVTFTRGNAGSYESHWDGAKWTAPRWIPLNRSYNGTTTYFNGTNCEYTGFLATGGLSRTHTGWDDWSNYTTGITGGGQLKFDLTHARRTGEIRYQVAVGSEIRVYTVIFEPKAGAVYLENLTISTGKMDPDFTTLMTDYTITLPYHRDKISFTATIPAGSGFTITGDAGTVSGAAGPVHQLNEGDNFFTVTVANGVNTRTYKIKVIRKDYVPVTDVDIDMSGYFGSGQTWGTSTQWTLLESVNPDTGALVANNTSWNIPHTGTQLNGMNNASGSGLHGISYRNSQSARSPIVYTPGFDWVNYTVESTMRISDDGNPRATGLVFRGTQEGDYYTAFYTNNTVASQGTKAKSFAIAKVVDSKWTILADITLANATTQLGLVNSAGTAPNTAGPTKVPAVEPYQPYPYTASNLNGCLMDLKLVVEDNTFMFYVNDTLLLTVTDGDIVKGSVGFITDRAVVGFYNLRVHNVVREEEFDGIIPEDRMMDWIPGVTVGVPGGIPYREAIFVNVLTTENPRYKCYADGVTDNTAAIRNAMLDCPADMVVYLPSGRYRIDSRIQASKSNITLRGDGQGKTIIIPYITNTGAFYLGNSDWPMPAANITITGGADKGSSTITVADASSIAVGKMIRVEPENQGYVKSLNGLESDTGNNKAYNKPMSFMFKVVSKTADTVTFTPQLPMDLSGMNPKVSSLPTYLMEGFGMESLTIDLDNSENSSYGIWLEQAWGCWIKDVEITNSEGRQMWFSTVSASEVRECYTHNSKGGGPDHEGIDFYNDSCWNLIEDNIVVNGGFPGIIIGDWKGGCQGNVIAYNYCEGVNTGSTVAGADISFAHGPHNVLNLVEGNVVNAIQADGYWGSSSHNTIFRNWTKGLPGNTKAVDWLKAIDICHFNSYYNVIGNILGTPDYSTVYEVGDSGYSTGIATLYRLGYPNMGNSGYTGKLNPSDPVDYSMLPAGLANNQQLDLNVSATMIRWGNFDYATNATRWETSEIPVTYGVSVPNNHDLPDSYYLPGKPDWWSADLAWPSIGPDLDNMTGKIPAQIRFEAIPEPDNAKLENITLSVGELTPAFNGDVTSYRVTVASDIDSIIIGAVAVQDGAVIEGLGTHQLAVGPNTIPLMVTSGSAVKYYTITVTRARDMTGVKLYENFAEADKLNDWIFVYAVDNYGDGSPVTADPSVTWGFNSSNFPNACYNGRSREWMSAIAYKDGVNWDNYIMAVNMTTAGSYERSMGIIFRATGNNFYIATLNNRADRFEFYKVVNGVRTVIANPVPTKPLGLAQGGASDMTIDLVLEANGNSFKFYVNDQLAAEFTDDTFSTGSVGFLANAAEVVYRELYVYDLEGEVTEPKVVSVGITPDTAVVEKGMTQQFTAIVEAVDGADETVTWSVDSTLSRIDEGGLLTVGTDETANTLTVTATSTFDSAKFATTTVTVKAAANTITVNFPGLKDAQIQIRVEGYGNWVYAGTGNDSATVNLSDIVLERGDKLTDAVKNGPLSVRVGRDTLLWTVEYDWDGKSDLEIDVPTYILTVPEGLSNVNVFINQYAYQGLSAGDEITLINGAINQSARLEFTIDGRDYSTQFSLDGTEPFDRMLIVNFPGVNSVIVEYYKTFWVNAGAYDNNAIVKADNGNYTIRVRKDGMSYTFSNVTLKSSEITVLDVPVKPITVAGIGGDCKLSVVQSNWVYQTVPFANGDSATFNVFDNGGNYQLQIINTGFHAIKIDGIDAGQIIDISDYFYTITVPEGVSAVRLQSNNWIINPANAGAVISLLKTGQLAKMSYIQGGQTYNAEFYLDGTDPFAKATADVIVNVPGFPGGNSYVQLLTLDGDYTGYNVNPNGDGIAKFSDVPDGSYKVVVTNAIGAEYAEIISFRNSKVNIVVTVPVYKLTVDFKNISNALVSVNAKGAGWMNNGWSSNTATFDVFGGEHNITVKVGATEVYYNTSVTVTGDMTISVPTNTITVESGVHSSVVIRDGKENQFAYLYTSDAKKAVHTVFGDDRNYSVEVGMYLDGIEGMKYVTIPVNVNGADIVITFDDIMAAFNAVVSAVPAVAVEKTNDDTNKLTVTITETLAKGTKNVVAHTFTIANNADGIYNVSNYKVYVGTQGNTKITACYIIN